MGECKLSNSADGWKQSYGVRVGRDTADTTDLVFTNVATSEFQLYPNEAAYLRDLLLAADIPGHPVEDDRYEAICGSLGFHPETELADVIEAIQSVRSEARNYPNYQFRIEELTGQVRRLRDALADSTTRCSCDAMYPCNKCDADMVLGGADVLLLHTLERPGISGDHHDCRGHENQLVKGSRDGGEN